MCLCVCSCVLFFVTPWTIARQVLLSIGFPRQEHWSGLPFPPPGDLPGPGTESAAPALQVVSRIAGGFFTAVPPGEPYWVGTTIIPVLKIRKLRHRGRVSKGI